MAESFIKIENLTKNFQMGKLVVKALNGVSLDIDKNAFTIIMGPSGSGKSTLLYMVGGLDRPTSGEIIIDTESVDAMDENQLAKFRRQRIGFVFQSFNLIPSMTALENVAFPMRFAKVNRKTRSQKAKELLEIVNLADRANHKPAELSGGEQQRVAIARALVNDPDLILADEPTGNLDTASGFVIMQTLKHLHDNGATLIIVTHDNRNRQFGTETKFLLDGAIVDENLYANATASIEPKI